jgi:hypothetical protein
MVLAPFEKNQPNGRGGEEEKESSLFPFFMVSGEEQEGGKIRRTASQNGA